MNNKGINNPSSVKSLKSNIIPREILRRGVYLATGNLNLANSFDGRNLNVANENKVITKNDLILWELPC